MLIIFLLAMCLVDDKKNDLELMQGDWKIVEATRNGKPWPKEELKKLSFRVKDNNFVILSGRPQPAIVSLDPKKSPKHFKMQIRGGRKGEFLLGIYEIKTDKLKICWSAPREKRPKDFKPQEKRFSFSLTRKDPNELPKKTSRALDLR